MIQPDRRQILTMFSQQSKKSRPPNGDSLTVVAKKGQKPPTPVTSSLNFYLSYTPISPQCGQLKPRMLKIQRFWAYILDFFI